METIRTDVAIIDAGGGLRADTVVETIVYAGSLAGTGTATLHLARI